eukprot:scaffold406597_cov28-Prasinocladus_malaysianus.AAC.1
MRENAEKIHNMQKAHTKSQISGRIALRWNQLSVNLKEEAMRVRVRALEGCATVGVELDEVNLARYPLGQMHDPYGVLAAVIDTLSKPI